MLFLGLCLLAAGSVAAQPAQERYSEVRLLVPPDGDLAGRLVAHGLVLDHAAQEQTPHGAALRTVLSARELDAVRASGIMFEVLVEDLAAEVAARPPFTEADRAAARALDQARGGIEGNVFGSMGGYPTYAEALAILDSMQAQYPHLISTRDSIGNSIQGRPIWLVELSDNPGVDEGEPEVLYTALHHAREPQGLATVLYFLWHLLENYGTDPEATHLLNDRRLFVVPILNPDGYIYNQTTSPNGGGMWRKNRRPVPPNFHGVDLNRNYGYEWGHDESGSSSYPGDETYRGASAFSEPETQAIRDFMEGGRHIRLAFNYHTYSDLLLFPWGYTYPDQTPDHAAFDRYARAMTEVNGYVYGPGFSTIYPTNGDADDWMYGEQTTKPMVFAFTPEVGSTGFWPTPAEILPLAEENLRANYLLAWYAGGFVDSATSEVAEDEPDGNGHLDPGERGLVAVTLRNDGLGSAEGVRVRLVSTNAAFVPASPEFGPPVTLAPGETVEVAPLGFTVAPGTALGYLDGLAFQFRYPDGSVLQRPLPAVRVGTPVALLQDDASSFALWHQEAPGGCPQQYSSHWGLSATAYSPPTSFADSPCGPYTYLTLNRIYLRDRLDLGEGGPVYLSFRTRWSIETDMDFGAVVAFPNGPQGGWGPPAAFLEGRYTQPGSGDGVQPAGRPLFEGTQTSWVEEVMDLTPFVGAPDFRLAFYFYSNVGVELDGWYVDDILIHRLTDGTVVGGEPAAEEPLTFGLAGAYPNPIREQARIPFTLSATADVELAVYDALGRRVRVLAEGERPAGPHEAVWDGRDAAGRRLASGVYVVRLDAGGRTASQRVAVVR
ncbi:MAG TPA: M14 family zinc carboxypeptidase [Rubricoccaceae bacterium]|nr:M14 family zinc carboxypeptidase [Rubricoccaceae bacterium]